MIYIFGRVYMSIKLKLPHYPEIAGFSEDSLARKTAEFVAWKIKNNVIPPSVSLHKAG